MKSTRLAILGGTGKEGKGLALRWARAGREVVIGSRDADKGRLAAETLRAAHDDGLRIEGGSNREAATAAEIIVSTLPHPGHLDILSGIVDALKGKVVITATIVWPPELNGKPSAPEMLHSRLGEDVHVAAAFQTVSAKTLALETSEPEDVLVFSDEATVREDVCRLVDETGLRGVDAGALAGARVAEALTGLLLGINKRYGIKRSGLRLTGIEPK